MDPKSHTSEQVEELLTQWRQKYDVFKEWTPLAIDIFEQLLAAHPDTSPRDVRQAIRRHVNHACYLNALASALARRFNLNGTPAGPVSETHSYVAAIKLNRLPQKPIQPREKMPTPGPNTLSLKRWNGT